MVRSGVRGTGIVVSCGGSASSWLCGSHSGSGFNILVLQTYYLRKGSVMEADVIGTTCRVIKTASSEIAVFGVELVGEQELRNVATALNYLGNHCVRTVVFRRDTPEGQMANCAFDSGAIAINVMHTLSKSFDRVYDDIVEGKEAVHLNMMMLFWHNFYVNYIHEALHLMDPAKEEEVIVAEAKKIVFDVERDSGFELNLSGSLFIQRNVTDMLNMDGEFYEEQKAMLKNHIVYQCKDDIKRTARDYFKVFSGAEFDDIRWKKSPITVPLETVIPTVNHMTMTEYAAETKPIETVIPAVITTVTTVASAGTGGFDQNIASNYNGDFDDNDFCPEPDNSSYGYDDGAVAPQTMTGYAASQPAPVYQPNVVTTVVTNNHIPAVTLLPATGLTNTQTAEITFGIYSKCYNRIFNDCGQQLNSDIAFANMNVIENQIKLTETEQKVLVGMNCYVNGRWVRLDSKDGLKGYVAKDANIPMYKLYLNCNGVEMCRLVLPQNVNKLDKSGVLSKTAQMARAGVKILYVNEGNDAVLQATGKRYRYKAVVEPGQQLTWQKC